MILGILRKCRHRKIQSRLQEKIRDYQMRRQPKAQIRKLALLPFRQNPKSIARPSPPKDFR